MLVDTASPARVIAVRQREEPRNDEANKDQASTSYRERNHHQAFHRDYLSADPTPGHRASNPQLAESTIRTKPRCPFVTSASARAADSATVAVANQSASRSPAACGPGTKRGREIIAACRSSSPARSGPRTVSRWPSRTYSTRRGSSRHTARSCSPSTSPSARRRRSPGSKRRGTRPWARRISTSSRTGSRRRTRISGPCRTRSLRAA